MYYIFLWLSFVLALSCLSLTLPIFSSLTEKWSIFTSQFCFLLCLWCYVPFKMHVLLLSVCIRKVAAFETWASSLCEESLQSFVYAASETFKICLFASNDKGTKKGGMRITGKCLQSTDLTFKGLLNTVLVCRWHLFWLDDMTFLPSWNGSSWGSLFHMKIFAEKFKSTVIAWKWLFSINSI